MADRILNLNQQIALLPATIPDSILDFLEDFNYGSPLQSENVRAAFDPEFLKAGGEPLRLELEKLRTDMGKLQLIQVDQAGREIPGGFSLKLTFERGAKGVGILTKLKERTILRALIQPGEYSEPGVKELLKNPPKLG